MDWEDTYSPLLVNSADEDTVADPGENLTRALHTNFERGGCGGRG